jgi:hypothetical protein
VVKNKFPMSHEWLATSDKWGILPISFTLWWRIDIPILHLKFSILHTWGIEFQSSTRGELIEYDFNSPLLSIKQDSLSNGELNFICQFPQMFYIFLLVVVYNKISPAIGECLYLHVNMLSLQIVIEFSLNPMNWQK